PHHKGSAIRASGVTMDDQLTALCAICGERLVASERTEGAERRWALRHWAGVDQDHEPDPTALSAQNVPLSCDFCGSEPTWAFQARYAIRVISYSEHDVVAHETREPWAACVACKRSILERDVDRMLHRRMTTERRPGLGDDPFVRDVLAEEALHNWDAFFESEPGDPYRFEEPPP